MATQPVTASGAFRFGDDFELDVRAYELRSAGTPLKLNPIPFELLLLLVERRGELVTRDEIVERIWGKGVFLDTDNSINGAISKIRQVLRDGAAQPRFIQTVTGRGYRFIAPVEHARPAAPEPSVAAPVETLIGKKISHYRILELLGGGGMGVVYKAEDLKLGRRVAIKFLPSELARDPKAFERMEREARAASALDHRNICSIYELDEHDGQPFIVMQLLEGQTLQDRLEVAAQQQSTMPLTEVLDIALQVADGLEAAHQKGFIHRDIKPANIFITTRNEVKILDFGLAKLTSAPDIDSDGAVESAAPPTTPAALSLTRTGIHMGTAFYMSPEQVRGEQLDARSDIFSFGLVLYQMLSGQRAFPGNTTHVVHDGILHNSPAPLREINPTLPAKLVSRVERCLEKERECRYQSAAALRRALEEVRSITAPASSTRRRRRIVLAAGGVVLLAMSAGVYWWQQRPLAQRAFRNYRMTALTSTGNVAYADISPDGRYLVYADDEVGRQSLWVQQLATSTTVRVLGPVPYYFGHDLRFTPDGNYVYYSLRDPDALTLDLYRLAVVGGAPEKILTEFSAYFSSVAFSPDGKRMVFTRHTNLDGTNYLVTANTDGTGEQSLLTLPARESMRMVAWAPDGKTIAFGIDEAGSGGTDCIAVIPSQGGKERRILRHGRAIFGVAWLPDGSGLIIAGSLSPTEDHALWIVSYPDGRLRKITNDLADYLGVSLTHAGAWLATVQKQLDSSLWVAPALNPSQATQLRQGEGREDGLMGLAWLADDRLVYGRGMLQSELWLVDRDGSHRQPLTHTNNAAETPSATPSGGKIIFSAGGAPLNLWAVDSDGRNLKQITTGPTNMWSPEISPDGKWITYMTTEGPWKMSLSGGEPTNLDPKGDYPTISPDGRWIAFAVFAPKQTKNEIKIVASDGKAPPRFLPFIAEPQIPLSTNMGSLPIRWTAAGDAITYVRTKDGVSNIWAQPIDGSPARQLTNFNSMLIWSHSWSRDGKWLVMARGNFSRDAVMLTDIH